MKKLVIICTIFLLAVGCQAQSDKTKRSIVHNFSDTTQPKVNWKVNKQYDDKGNLISYDSTYTWTYSRKNSKDVSINIDSVMTAFRTQFNMQFPSFFNRSFGEPVWSDSLLYNDFLRPDYFMKRYQSQYFDMENIMRSLDSMRNNFLRERYPGLQQGVLKTKTM
jgi:hypothetical protein